MNEDIQREARQRDLIAQELAAYRRGQSGLVDLSQHLQALVTELRMAPTDWLTAFQTEVNELEVLYAIALDQGVADDLPEDYRSNAEATERNLQALLEQLPALPGGDVP